MSDRTTMLLLLQSLLEQPNQSARELAGGVLGNPRTRTAERGAVTRLLSHLFAVGIVVESSIDPSTGIAARRYAVAPGIGAMTLDLALAQDLTLWEALLLSSPLGAQAEAS